MKEFTALAQYYDRFVGADYQEIVAFIDRMIKKYKPNASLVCDIGCGSGTVTLALLDKGYDMIGIDGSIEMLNEAFDKRILHENADKALFLCQQLPEFELYGTVDVILSTMDTINYLTDERELDRLFYWFQNYLNPNGLLIFDVNALYKYETLLKNHCDVYDEDDVYMVWRSDFDGELCSHQITIFELMDEGYQRFDEQQLQRYYSQTQISSLLKKYGFSLLGVRNGYSDDEPGDQTERLTFIARKEK